jgi:histidine triad (HIT) family protein
MVYENDTIMAFMDLFPVNEGHLLVIPRDHYASIGDVPPDVAARMFLVAQKLAAAIRSSALRAEGINFFLADGAAAYQEVFHSHLHVVPRFAGDRFRIHIDRYYQPDRSELDRAAAAIQDVLAAGN